MPRLLRLILIYFATFLLSFIYTGLVYAFPSSSTNYKLDAEFGVFGGEKNSTNFRLTDTGGGFAPGFGDSTNYRNCSGFQCTLSQVPSITFSLSTNSISLGTLTTSAVNTQSHTATVTTNWNGYTLTVVQDGNLRRGSDDIDPVVSSPISAGTEAYGLATSKSGQAIVQDTSCGSAVYNASSITSTPQNVASSTVATSLSGDTTTLCYSASVAGSTPAGTYSQIVTYIATGTF